MNTEGFLITPQKKWKIFYYDHLDWAMYHMVNALTRALSGKDPIKPEMFEKGVGYFQDLKWFFEPDDDSPFRNSPFQEVYDKYLQPSMSNELLNFLGNNDWLYHHEGKIYLELAELFEPDEFDDDYKQKFEVFMQNYSFKRFEITRETAQQWISIGETIMEAIHAAGKAGKLWGPEPDMP
ncbi:hypothetical protein COW36_06080 [bacterium (Candidatus Blackallbacteria) CG17_big_fil_post_rev_8_21_14_2_50_48_46]|uniref:Uncharacterized protein n=1 Tax=bacterium (Candidatus Blackallbacteria) CG17_big_fil_post_rev_8_21_14_2_50_48_46 TaxID=2014261 RepID=A0A2M7G7N6_9BACT|nr:MAG: hypothetical protein COW64_16910 [bacterium (Candidatus Blackallbacteria) CG18_big_fil_WC_8_21_14_2_50_49_26]PIW18095.1 MAG: hypothetical protein COW36_06080 [bacterium (Candidatus Blackallbacteria) CG17_big_fil_post_rev_8_21_14_2_50_48_46]PIW51104.1 MAG: hypothetical protein COW20_00230 [bacterium (Candidatus Blackallbacteria) CG13_big_fil_rev_8_21_14_2_50_49_14]